MRPKEESQVEQRKIYEDIALRTEGDIYIASWGRCGRENRPLSNAS